MFSVVSHSDSIISTWAEINMYLSERTASSVQSLNTKHVCFGVRVMWQLETLSRVPALFTDVCLMFPPVLSSGSECVCHWLSKTWVCDGGNTGFFFRSGAVLKWKVYILYNLITLVTLLVNLLKPDLMLSVLLYIHSIFSPHNHCFKTQGIFNV